MRRLENMKNKILIALGIIIAAIIIGYLGLAITR